MSLSSPLARLRSSPSLRHDSSPLGGPASPRFGHSPSDRSPSDGSPSLEHVFNYHSDRGGEFTQSSSHYSGGQSRPGMSPARGGGQYLRQQGALLSPGTPGGPSPTTRRTRARPAAAAFSPAAGLGSPVGLGGRPVVGRSSGGILDRIEQMEKRLEESVETERLDERRGGGGYDDGEGAVGVGGPSGGRLGGQRRLSQSSARSPVAGGPAAGEGWERLSGGHTGGSNDGGIRGGANRGVSGGTSSGGAHAHDGNDGTLRGGSSGLLPNTRIVMMNTAEELRDNSGDSYYGTTQANTHASGYTNAGASAGDYSSNRDHADHDPIDYADTSQRSARAVDPSTLMSSSPSGFGGGGRGEGLGRGGSGGGGGGGGGHRRAQGDNNDEASTNALLRTIRSRIADLGGGGGGGAGDRDRDGYGRSYADNRSRGRSFYDSEYGVEGAMDYTEEEKAFGSYGGRGAPATWDGRPGALSPRGGRLVKYDTVGSVVSLHEYGTREGEDSVYVSEEVAALRAEVAALRERARYDTFGPAEATGGRMGDVGGGEEALAGGGSPITMPKAWNREGGGSSNRVWLCADNDRPVEGPMTRAELEALVIAGEYTTDRTLVQRVGTESWHTIAALPTLCESIMRNANTHSYRHHASRRMSGEAGVPAASLRSPPQQTTPSSSPYNRIQQRFNLASAEPAAVHSRHAASRAAAEAVEAPEAFGAEEASHVAIEAVRAARNFISPHRLGPTALYSMSSMRGGSPAGGEGAIMGESGGGVGRAAPEEHAESASFSEARSTAVETAPTTQTVAVIHHHHHIQHVPGTGMGGGMPPPSSSSASPHSNNGDRRPSRPYMGEETATSAAVVNSPGTAARADARMRDSGGPSSPAKRYSALLANGKQYGERYNMLRAHNNTMHSQQSQNSLPDRTASVAPPVEQIVAWDGRPSSTRVNNDGGGGEDVAALRAEVAALREHAKHEKAAATAETKSSETASSSATGVAAAGAGAAATRTTGLTPQAEQQNSRVDQMRAVFDTIDRNHDGSINVRELLLCLRKHPDVAEFMHLPMHVHQEGGTRETFEEMFQAMDKDGSRDITWPEFEAYFAAPAVGVTDTEHSDGQTATVDPKVSAPSSGEDLWSEQQRNAVMEREAERIRQSVIHAENMESARSASACAHFSNLNLEVTSLEERQELLRQRRNALLAMEREENVRQESRGREGEDVGTDTRTSR